ncbi:MAG: transketolase C-terminal domain-containing protein [Sediminispirochaetaceae bacterium]
MPVIDSSTSKIRHDYTIKELQAKADEIRSICIRVLAATRTEVPDSLLSHVDIAVLLYFKHLRHDPVHPLWEDRDRIYWSAQFDELSMRVILAMAGYLSLEEALAGQQNMDVSGMEFGRRCYGNTLGIAAGDALRAKMDGRGYQVFSIMDAADQQDGGVWEAANFAASHQLANLVGIVLQPGAGGIDPKRSHSRIDLLADKYASFGWHVVLMNGNNIRECMSTLGSVRNEDVCPTAIITDISPISSEADAGRKLRTESLGSIIENAVRRLNVRNGDPVSSRTRYSWNSVDTMRVELEPIAQSVLDTIAAVQQSDKTIELSALEDESFGEKAGTHKAGIQYPVQLKFGRVVGSICAVAAGLVRGDKQPVLVLNGISSCLEQLRTMICPNNLNIKIIDLSRDSVGNLPLLYSIPGLLVEVPCDAVEMKKAVRGGLEQKGPAVICGSNQPGPVVTREDGCFRFGVANVIRYRARADKFTDAFEIAEGWAYSSENEEISIITIGPLVAEAMRAAYVLKEEYGIESRILNTHTVNPLDIYTLSRAAEETGCILTVEQQPVSVFGNLIAGALSTMKKSGGPGAMEMLCFDETEGGYAIAADTIVSKAIELLETGHGE